ncbi:MAG: hypothetical protein JW944_00680 [Deltaproteobacteria bacterium]|nr:hypothetical protein [Deltaproteobacteria bacterium]
MKTTRLDEFKCPWCGYALDAVSNADINENFSPKPGDLSICINCGGWLEFADDMKLIKPSPGNIAALPIDTTESLVNLTENIKKANILKQFNSETSIL